MTLRQAHTYRESRPGDVQRWDQPGYIEGMVATMRVWYQLAWSRPTVTPRPRVGNEFVSQSGVNQARALAQAGDVAGAWRYLAEQLGDEYAALSYDSATGQGPTGAYVANMWNAYWREEAPAGSQSAAFNAFAQRQVLNYIDAMTVAGGSRLLTDVEIERVYERTILDLQAAGYDVDNTLIGHAIFAEINRIAEALNIGPRASWSEALGLGLDRQVRHTDNTLDLTPEQFNDAFMRVQESATAPAIIAFANNLYQTLAIGLADITGRLLDSARGQIEESRLEFGRVLSTLIGSMSHRNQGGQVRTAVITVSDPYVVTAQVMGPGGVVLGTATMRNTSSLPVGTQTIASFDATGAMSGMSTSFGTTGAGGTPIANQIDTLVTFNGAGQVAEVDSAISINGKQVAEVEQLTGRTRTGNAGGADQSAQLRQMIAGQIGGTVGSTLGNYLGGGDRLKGVLYSSLLGEIGERMGHALNAAIRSEDAIAAARAGGIDTFGAQVGIRAGQAAIGTISSWLSLELGEALGLKGFGAELFTTIGTTVTNHVIGNLLAGTDYTFAGINTGEIGEGLASGDLGLKFTLANALGAFIGAKLGSMVVSPQTQAAGILSSIGSAVGAFSAVSVGTFSSAIASTLGIKTTSLLFNFLAPGIGAFVGFIMGALIGNLFGRKKPKIPSANAEIYLDYTTDRFELGLSSAVNGGNLDLVKNIASTARDTLNGFLTILAGDMPAETTSWGQGLWRNGSYLAMDAGLQSFYGHTGGQLWVKLGSPNAAVQNVASADDAVSKGVIWSLASTQVIGGDIFAKRAILSSPSAELTAKLGDLQIAGDYRYYVNNRDLIDGYIRAAYATLTEPEQAYYASQRALIDKLFSSGERALSGSELATYQANKALIDKVVLALNAQAVANPWIITLQRVNELKLDQWARSDFYGGLPGFLMSMGMEASGSYLEDVTARAQGGLRIAMPQRLQGGPLAVLAQSDSNGWGVTVNNLAAIGYVAEGLNTSGNDLIDRSGDTQGVVIEDYRSEGYEYGYWQWVGWGPQPIEMYEPMEGDPNWQWVTYSNVVTTTGGDDIFIGGYGNDSLYGHGGWDWLEGGAGADFLDGGTGNDVLLGQDGADTLHGGAGNDYLAGGADADILRGDDGADTLVGGAGGDILEGGAGDDILLVDQADGAYDSLSGGDGRDALSFERWTTGINFTLGSGWVAEDSYSGIEDVTGTRHNDTIVGDAQANRLRGLDGADTIYGGDGDDVIEGGAGADVLNGQGGSDTVSYEASSVGVFVDLSTNSVRGGDASGDSIAGFENIRGSRGADELKGDAGANRIEGGQGDDWIVATTGSDVYDGGEGADAVDFSKFTSGVTVNLGGGGASGYGSGAGFYHSFTSIEGVVGTDWADSLSGGAGEQEFMGGKGSDTLSGGAGGDTYYFDLGDGWDTIYETNDGSNVVSFGAGIGFNQLTFSLSAGPSGYMDVFYSASDRVRLYGNVPTVKDGKLATAEDNKIKVLDMNGSGQLDISQFERYTAGSAAGDVLSGLRTLGDLIAGFGGNDTIYGMQPGQWDEWGNIIIGGAGNDTIITSVGDDQFAFERGSGRDTITDSGGEDTIVFGPNVAAEDVIYKVVGNDLYIGIADRANGALGADQVADYIRIVGGGVQWQDVYSGQGYYNTVEYINAGGSWVDLRKLNIDWTVQYTYGGGVMPIVLDLNGDGLDLTGVDSSMVVSQLSSGELARTSWVGPMDGILAYDRNGDGQINRLSEISFVGDKEGARTDLEGLEAWDTNGDGKLNALDDGWSKLLVWVDRNQNGRSTAQELRSLEEAGIAEIDLKGKATGNDPNNTRDSIVHNTMSFTWASGETGKAYDVQLARKLLNELGLTADQVRAAWGDIDADGELGRLAADPVVSAAAGAIFAQERRQAATFTSAGSIERIRHELSLDDDHGAAPNVPLNERPRADFSDHDDRYAEDEARWADVLNGVRYDGEAESTTDGRVRATLETLKGDLARGRFSPGLFKPEIGGGRGIGYVGAATPEAAAPRMAPRSAGVGTTDYGPAVRITADALSDSSVLDEAADLLASENLDAVDAWADAAPVTLAEHRAQQRWWTASLNRSAVGEPQQAAIASDAFDQVSPLASRPADPSILSAHQRLAQAMAGFGSAKGGGAAIWVRAGQASDATSVASDSRGARWASMVSRASV